jgi:hypothetical protein
MKITPEMFGKLDNFTLLTSTDGVKQELTCGLCKECICDAEHRDSLLVLAMTALAHIPHCKEK